MFKYTTGDLLKAQTEAIINTTNTVGVMGKGIALAFKKQYPENYKVYRKAFDNDELAIGNLLVFNTGLMFPKYIINFPTKKHWRNPSKLDYIESGLIDLVHIIQTKQIKSIAIPPLGCGNGKLQWATVKPLIEKHLQPVSDTCEIIIYEPGFQPKMPAANQAKKLTNARAMLLHLLVEYEKAGYTINMLVAQKLAYFLQQSGENLSLDYEKGWYGPYSRKLNYVLNYLNGSYLEFAAQATQPNTSIAIKQEKIPEVNQYLQDQLTQIQKDRLASVLQLIEGFESSFGLELLGTVDFIRQNCPTCTPPQILEDIQNWTNRKKELFDLYQVEVAYERLAVRV